MAGGGYRQPSSPAPVSGPGALSKRTDGQSPRWVPGQDYGDGAELMTAQQGAPMAGSGARQRMGAGMEQLLTQPTTPLPEGTQYPDEPLTAGAPIGPGAGPEVLASAAQTGPTRDRLMAALPALMRAAERPNASKEMRALVRYLRSQL